MQKELRIAIIHDAFIVRGGAERVALYLSDLFPEADIYTPAYSPENTFSELKEKNVITHPWGKNFNSERKFKQLYPLWCFWLRSLNLDQYDIIISSSTYLAKHIRAPKNGLHFCYLHTPFRFLWSREVYDQNSLPFSRFIHHLIDIFIPILKRWDKTATRKIDHLIANSQHMQKRIKQVYDCETIVINPPIQFKKYATNKPDDFYLFAGRLLPYKRADLAIQACQKLGKKLLIIGEGPNETYLKSLANDDIEFLGTADDALMQHCMSSCQALLFPGIEDFGMIPIETQACGRPVIAYNAGGAKETVKANISGIFFDEPSADSLAEAILKFEKMQFDSHTIRQSVTQFDIENFNAQIKNYIFEKYQEFIERGKNNR